MGIVDVRSGQGVVNVRRNQVQEWLLPTLSTALGDAQIILSGWAEIKVSVLAPALATSDCAAPISVSGSLADATVSLFGSVFIHPLVLASSVVEFDNTGSSLKDVALPVGVAVVEVSAPADLVAAGSATAAIALDEPTILLAVQVTGVAEVEFAYYGDGNYPVFPYSFPALFTGNSVGVQDADALVGLTGVGEIAAVSGFADVVLPAFTGDVALDLKGSTPIFPWFLPVVFDDLPANVSLAPAVVLLGMTSDSVVAVVGESTAAINAPGSSLPSAVFPWKFPVILIGAE